MAEISFSNLAWSISIAPEDLQNESLSFDICDVQFLSPGTSYINPLLFSDGSIGQIDLELVNNTENFEDDFEDRSINNSAIFETVQTFDFSPSALDLNGNGYVSTGDIAATFDSLIGSTVSNNPELGLFDFDEDGAITVMDLLGALTYAGYPTFENIEPASDAYPRYLDDHSDDVAFACSLRKLRSDYDGPCMRVKLDYDKRSLNNYNPVTFVWNNYPREFDPNWNPQSLSVEFLMMYDYAEQYRSLEEDYPFLAGTVDIGFTEDGYFDYEKILLLMEDPLAVFQPSLSPEQVQDFNDRYTERQQSPLVGQPPGPYKSLHGSCVVTIQEWCDQSINNNGFKSREPTSTVIGGDYFHPFRTSGLLIGWNDYASVNEPVKKIVSYQNIPCVGVGSTIGLGDRPWEEVDIQGESVVNQPLGALTFLKGWNCFAYPQSQYGGVTLQGSFSLPGWEAWMEGGKDSDSPGSGPYDVGRMYMKQDFNPFFESDESLYVYNANGVPSKTKGKRTIFRSGFDTGKQQSGSFGHNRGSAFRGSFQGDYSMFRESYLDQVNDSGTNEEDAPYSSNWGGFQHNGQDVSTFGGTFRSNQFKNDPVSSFACNMEFGEVSYHSFLSGWGYYAEYYRTPNTDIPATITFTENDSSGIILGTKQLSSGVPNAKGLANTMEFIAWNDNLGEQSVDNYVRESREYFGRKTLDNDQSFTL